MIHTVYVTDFHIRTGHRQSRCHCPIARALTERLGQEVQIEVPDAVAPAPAAG